MVSVCSTFLSIWGLCENHPQPWLAKSRRGGGSLPILVNDPPSTPTMASFLGMQLEEYLSWFAAHLPMGLSTSWFDPMYEPSTAPFPTTSFCDYSSSCSQSVRPNPPCASFVLIGPTHCIIAALYHNPCGWAYCNALGSGHTDCAACSQWHGFLAC